MKSIAKLKDKARKHEQKEDWQAAIQVYQQVLDTQAEEEDLEVELSLFNRIGDLNLRLGQTDEAVKYYETAADHYAESGFFNNAIALCNKALRHRPDRPDTYLKLSRLCTEQGFQTDARRWILEYAEREMAAGEVEAAMEALEDFAEMSNDPEVRELLAQQLADHDRPDEAVEQLRAAYGMRVQAGEVDAAAAVAETAREIDPNVDLESEAPTVPAEAPAGDAEGVEATDFEAAAREEAGPADAMDEGAGPAGEGMERLETRAETVEAGDAATVEGLESTHVDTGMDETGADEVSGLEVGFSEREAAAPTEDVDSDTLGGLETFSPAPGAEEQAVPEDETPEEPEREAEEAAQDIEEAAPDIEEAAPETEEVAPETEDIAARAELDAGLEDFEGSQDFEDEEEAEPLPLLDDAGFEDEADDVEDVSAVPETELSEKEAEGEAEPLPTLDTGLEAVEDETEEAPAEEAPSEELVEEEPSEEEPSEEEPPEEEPPEEEPPAEEPPEEEPSDELSEEELAAAGAGEGGVEGGLDLSFETGEQPTDEAGEAAHEADTAEAATGSSDDAMDLDLESFDLGIEAAAGPEEQEVAVEDLDVEAIIGRARELVSRGLMGEALRELRVLSGSDAGSDIFQDAMGVVNEIVRHDENDLSALQRRVEYAARIGDRGLLVDAYLDLADALVRLGAETKARAMYERARDLDPDNEAALEALDTEEEEDETVDLDAILREMGPEELEAAGAGREPSESDPNFAAMLNQFKAKVTENVEPDDAGDHYDLGLAFKEMGLIDEAIAEFQTALTGGEERLKVYEELGQCFVQKNQYNVALKVFKRALKVPHTDDEELLGVYYHMGQCHEELGQREEARDAYEKVLAIDESFADVPDRVARL